MRKVHVYLVRHGQTTANRDFILQGHADYPLTDLGIQQAQLCGEHFKEHKWDIVQHSDLGRTAHTTQLLTDVSHDASLSKRLEPTELLREISFGVREGLSRSLNVEQAIAVVAKKLNIPESEVKHTAETTEQVARRQASLLIGLKHRAERIYRYRELAASGTATQNTSSSVSLTGDSDIDLINTTTESISGDCVPLEVLCVSHGGFIKQFIRRFCKDIPLPPKIGNCSVSKFTLVWSSSEGENEEGEKDQAEKMEKELTRALVNAQYEFRVEAIESEINQNVIGKLAHTDETEF